MNLQFDFALKTGEFSLEMAGAIQAPMTGVFGPSGCGKTTFLHVLAGLRRPKRGFLKLDDTWLFHDELGVWVPPHKRRIAIVFQEARLFPHLSVSANLRFGLDLVPPGEKRFTLEDIIHWLDLASLIDTPTPKLSGGERQRVALGRALLSAPRLLLLDEPLTGLDRGHRRNILNLFKQIQEQTGIPMIHVSHDLGELLQLGDRLWVMRDGRLVGHDFFLDLVTRPPIHQLIHDLGLLNVIKMEVIHRDEHKGITHLRPLADPTRESIWHGPFLERDDAQVFVALRPEDIALVNRPVSGTSIQNQVWGRIDHVITAGPRVLVVISTSVRLLVEITPHAALALNLQPGMDIFCMFKAQALRIL